MLPAVHAYGTWIVSVPVGQAYPSVADAPVAGSSTAPQGAGHDGPEGQLRDFSTGNSCIWGTC